MIGPGFAAAAFAAQIGRRFLVFVLAIGGAGAVIGYAAARLLN